MEKTDRRQQALRVLQCVHGIQTRCTLRLPAGEQAKTIYEIALALSDGER